MEEHDIIRYKSKDDIETQRATVTPVIKSRTPTMIIDEDKLIDKIFSFVYRTGVENFEFDVKQCIEWAWLNDVPEPALNKALEVFSVKYYGIFAPSIKRQRARIYSNDITSGFAVNKIENGVRLTYDVSPRFSMVINGVEKCMKLIHDSHPQKATAYKALLRTVPVSWFTTGASNKQLSDWLVGSTRSKLDTTAQNDAINFLSILVDNLVIKFETPTIKFVNFSLLSKDGVVSSPDFNHTGLSVTTNKDGILNVNATEKIKSAVQLDEESSKENPGIFDSVVDKVVGDKTVSAKKPEPWIPTLSRINTVLPYLSMSGDGAYTTKDIHDFIERCKNGYEAEAEYVLNGVRQMGVMPEDMSNAKPTDHSGTDSVNALKGLQYQIDSEAAEERSVETLTLRYRTHNFGGGVYKRISTCLEYAIQTNASTKVVDRFFEDIIKKCENTSESEILTKLLSEYRAKIKPAAPLKATVADGATDRKEEEKKKLFQAIAMDVYGEVGNTEDKALQECIKRVRGRGLDMEDVAPVMDAYACLVKLHSRYTKKDPEPELFPDTMSSNDEIIEDWSRDLVDSRISGNLECSIDRLTAMLYGENLSRSDVEHIVTSAVVESDGRYKRYLENKDEIRSRALSLIETKEDKNPSKLIAAKEMVLSDGKTIAIRVAVKKSKKIVADKMASFIADRTTIRFDGESDADFLARAEKQRSSFASFLMSDVGQGIISYGLGTLGPSLIEAMSEGPTKEALGLMCHEMRISGGTEALESLVEEFLSPVISDISKETYGAIKEASRAVAGAPVASELVTARGKPEEIVTEVLVESATQSN